MILRRLWREDSGFVNSTDVILLTTILALGMIVGLVMMRNQVVQEFTDAATAIGFLNQTYSYTGDDENDDNGDDNFVFGSSYTDEPDVGDVPDQPGQEPGGISVVQPGAGPNVPTEL